MTDHAVRPARARDLPLLAAIEDSGLAMFEAVLGDLSGDALASPAVSGHVRAAEPGFILVAGDPVVGFAHVVDLESHAHLDQISVHPDHAGRGVGTALLEGAAQRATLKGHGSLTLTTYADIAWNAPFYARHGFAEFADDELGEVGVPVEEVDACMTHRRVACDHHEPGARGALGEVELRQVALPRGAYCVVGHGVTVDSPVVRLYS